MDTKIETMDIGIELADYIAKFIYIFRIRTDRVIQRFRYCYWHKDINLVRHCDTIYIYNSDLHALRYWHIEISLTFELTDIDAIWTYRHWDTDISSGFGLHTFMYWHWHIFHIWTYIHWSTDIDISFVFGLSYLDLHTLKYWHWHIFRTQTYRHLGTDIEDSDCIHWGTDIDISFGVGLIITYIYVQTLTYL